jgi:HPt (histidine-containing phosphotransfer) domain-containing protein
MSVDFERIKDTSGGDKEFEQDLFGIFLQDCAERMDKLQSAIAGGDIATVRLEAHTIKGSGANVGTTHLQEIAAALEHAEDVDVTRNGPALLEELKTEFAKVRGAIDSYLGSS